MVIGIDKDCSQGRVYWSDISSRQILSAKYDGTDKKIFIQEGCTEQKLYQKIFFCIMNTNFNITNEFQTSFRRKV